ncbi:MAG: hypothetical protein PHG03_01955 [Bacilli bacterium]|nr:hypothetical protein [Bacilli bacterium]MDD4795308.1 hypothetical protein [Bacilli bacterium]
MKTDLFANEEQKKDIYNLLAARKLKDKRKEREKYESEIEESLNICGKILKTHGSRSNFIEDIYKLESSMEPKGILPSSSTRDESKYTEQIASLLAEKKEFLKKFPLEVTEDIDYNSKKINDRKERRESTLKRDSNIIDLFPESKNLDLEQAVLAHETFFASIAEFKGEPIVEKEEVVPFTDNVIEINNYRQEVKGIKEAPKSILKKANLIDLTDYKEKLAEPITNTPLIDHNNLSDESNEKDLTQKDQSFTAEPLHSITEDELNGTLSDEPVLNIENTVKEPEEVVEETIEASEPEIDIQENVENTEKESEEVIEETIEVKEPEIVEQEATLEKDNIVQFPDSNIEKEPQQFEEESLVPFVMPEDITLTDLAIALYENADDWISIYAANQEEFNKIVQEKNNGIIDNVENNAEIFAGLTIKVPTVFVDVAKEEVLGKTA